MSGGEKAAEAYLTALAPEILGIPIVQFLLDEAVSYVGQILSVAEQKYADAIVIDIQAGAEKSDVINSGVALQLAMGSGNQDAINLAATNLKNAYKGLITWDGSATPV
jgi:hypothetical protein